MAQFSNPMGSTKAMYSVGVPSNVLTVGLGTVGVGEVVCRLPIPNEATGVLSAAHTHQSYLLIERALQRNSRCRQK